MALKHYNPTSPAQRGLILVDRSALHKGKPVKALTEGKRKTGGRNNKGHVTSRGIAGGHKQRYRIIDFKRRKWDVEATVERLEYDPNRSAFIALVTYTDGEQAYIIAPQRLAAGDKVIAGKKTDVKPGNAMELGQMPVGTIIHNIEMKPGKGARSPAPPAPSPSSWPRKTTTPSSACPPARSARSTWTATRPSAPSATCSTRTSRSARPAAPAGRASARPSAAWS